MHAITNTQSCRMLLVGSQGRQPGLLAAARSETSCIDWKLGRTIDSKPTSFDTAEAQSTMLMTNPPTATVAVVVC